jgi:hypothetical protein
MSLSRKVQSMSWDTFRRRGETLRVVVETANERRDGVLPTDVPGVAENFADELDLIGALQLKWHARLSGNIERTLMREPMDLESAVASAWRTTAEQLAGLRMVIDRCVEQPHSPEMATSTSRACRLEWARLATAAGLASGRSDAAVEVGRRIEVKARQDLDLESAESAEATESRDAVESPEARQEARTPVSGSKPGRHAATESFVDRIRAALAAA